MKVTENKDLALLIDVEYNKRYKQEYGKTRITTLIYDNKEYWDKRDKDKQPVSNTNYLNTYWHDTLKDVVGLIYLQKGFIPYKECFICSEEIKGHGDILLYDLSQKPIAIIEVKNYQYTTVFNGNRERFDKQCLLYCALQRVYKYILIVRNGKGKEGLTLAYEYELDKSDFDNAWNIIREGLAKEHNKNE